MKTRYNALHSVAMVLSFLLVGASGAWADLKTSATSSTACTPKVHFKLPEGWTNAFLMISGSGNLFPKADANGWTTFDFSSKKTNDDNFFFINGVNKNDCNDGLCVTVNAFGSKTNNARVEGFQCSHVNASTSEIWIQEHPDPNKAGQVYVTKTEPNVKDFYVFLPDNQAWKSAIPVIREDGKDRELHVDPSRCGWRFRRYIDEPLPEKVLIHKKSDASLAEAIGMNGEKDLNAGISATPIELAGIFNAFEADAKYSHAAFFIADEKKAAEHQSSLPGWFVERPEGVVGDCRYFLAAKIYDTDASLHPLFSCWRQGADVSGDGCQAAEGGATTAAQGVAKTEALTAIYSCLGVHTGLVESTLDKATKKPKLSAAGKKCFIDDKYFNQLFNYTPSVNEFSCYDLPFDLASDGKWEFDSDTYLSDGLTVKIPGGFYPVEDTDNAKILATLLPDGSVQTPLPAARKKRYAQGPVYYGSRLRENDPTEQIPRIDVFCNGPGWNKGHDCGERNHLFNDGTETEEAIRTAMNWMNDVCVFGWSCPNDAPAGWPLYKTDTEDKGTEDSRWGSDVSSKNGGRNQHFCFESHADFVYQPGLKFNFRGDDDIWVFIDNKLAVDLGGTHLAAPAYVDVDYFLKKNGVNLDSATGKHYDIDIFFCDRRTTMSNVRIKTNMFLEQTTGIKSEEKLKEFIQDFVVNGDNHIRVCFKESSSGKCGGAGEKESCRDTILTAGYKLGYVFTQDSSLTEPAECDEACFAKTPRYYNGGVDVTKPGDPVVNDDSLRVGRGPGDYYLVVKIYDKDGKFLDKGVIHKLTVKGSIGVANRNAIIDDNGSITQLPHKSWAMATSDSVSVDQLIPVYIGAVTDPCGNVQGCTDPLKFTPSQNSQYSLLVQDVNGKDVSNKVNFYKLDNGKLSVTGISGRALGAGGVDTLYVSVPYAEMTGNEEKIIIKTTDNALRDTLSFIVPKIEFVESETSLKIISKDDNDFTRMRGLTYEFYVAAFIPQTKADGTLEYVFCSDCNFKLGQGASKTSSGITFKAPDMSDFGGLSTVLVNGRAKFFIKSDVVYERCDAGAAAGCKTASIQVLGEGGSFQQAIYENMQFVEPPVPTPKFADIFDVHGELPASDLNIPAPYFDKNKEYLDGIGDSIVVYYMRNFHRDSLPSKIAVFWDHDDKDSVVFEGDEIKAGSVCGSAAGLNDTLCKPRITLGGKKFSKAVKTNGKGKVKSWATFKSRGGEVVTKFYTADVYDRIAPIIISARVTTESQNGVDAAQLKVQFSEDLQRTDEGAAEGDKVLSFYINNGKNPEYADYLPFSSIYSLGASIDSSKTMLYDQSKTFPQAGDYIRIRGIAGFGLLKDMSDYADYPGGDTIRSADEANFKWNTATGYDATVRLPSPWVLVSGEVSSYAERIIGEGYGGVPLSPSDIEKLPPSDVFTYDANKDMNDFKNDMLNGTGEFGDYHFVPHGWFIKSDMGALIESKEQYAQDSTIKENTFFDYEINLFSNLGSHVLTKNFRIYCDDKKNKAEFKREFFGGTDCVQKRMNVFVIWNMKSDKKRLVGSGAYVSKVKSFVQLGKFGKKNKIDKTEMWGVRHNTKVIGSLPIIKGK